MYCASVGIEPQNIEGLNYLENDILDLPSKFIPLQTSYTQSGSGRPTKDPDDLTDNGEKSKEQK